MLSCFLNSRYKLDFIFFEKKESGGRSPASMSKLIPAAFTLLSGSEAAMAQVIQPE